MKRPGGTSNDLDQVRAANEGMVFKEPSDDENAARAALKKKPKSYQLPTKEERRRGAAKRTKAAIARENKKGK